MPPANDAFPGTTISGGHGSTTGSNVGATMEVGEPAPIEGDGTNTSSVWWTWTAPSSGNFIFDLSGSAFDTTLEVFTGSSLGALTLVGSDDDSGAGATSKITIAATAGVTYRIRVMGWWDGEPEGAIALEWHRDIPAPDITSRTPSAGQVGTTVAITGTNFSAVDSVTFAGVEADFTIDSSTHITATVPITAAGVNSPIVVGNEAGSDSYTGFTPLHPGPWIQPPDQTAVYDMWGTSANFPDATSGHEVVTGTGAPPRATSVEAAEDTANAAANFEVGQATIDTIEYGYRGKISIKAVDLGTIKTDDQARADQMPAIPPSSGELAAPDVWDFEYEGTPPPSGNPGGVYAGGGYDLTLTAHPAQDNQNYWVDDEDGKTLNLTDDMWSARIQWRRFDTAELTFLDYARPRLTDPTTWPSVPGTAYVDEAFVSDLADIELAAGYPDGNYVQTVVSMPEISGTLHLDDGDLDDSDKLAVALVLDRLIDAPFWAPPLFDPAKWPVHGPSPYSNGAIWKQASVVGSASIQWAYTPPRYRLLYTTPQVFGQPPLAHRQRRDGAATPGPPLSHRQGGVGLSRPPLAHRQHTP